MNNLSGIEELQDKLGYRFKDSKYLLTALSHSSYVNEKKIDKNDDYERLEFLGDAVLELAVSRFLFNNKPDMREGDMTKLRASLVCEPTLAYCAKEELDLGKYILLGKGEEVTGGRGRDSIISDVFEAVIGAVYLDSGFDEASRLIEKYILDDMENKIEFVDSKTILQEYAQEYGLELKYNMVEEIGPAHDKIYRMRCTLGDIYVAESEGKTKKSGEQHAAYAILRQIRMKSE